MRICFLSGDIGRSGGTERVATVIASGLADCGYDVSILSIGGGLQSYFPLSSKVHLFSLNMENKSANLSDVIIWFRLHKFLKQKGINLVIDVDTVLSWYSIPATWGTDAEVISWEHFHFFINVGDVFQRFRRAAGRLMATKFAKAVVTLTDKDRQQFLKHLTCSVPLIAIPNPKTIAHEFRSSLDAKVVLTAGRLVPQKGFDLLLEAWAQIQPLPVNWRLRIVGSGREEEVLKTRAHILKIAESVDFVPHASDMAAQFTSAAVYACSSRFEGLPLALIEAKSFGLPIVSFDCDCGPSDIVRNGTDGVLVPKEDVACLARGLRELMLDDERRKRFGQRAYEDTRYELNNVVKKWKMLIK